MIIDLSHGGVRAYAVQLQTPGLGDNSYVLVVGDEAVVIDPQRDLDRFRRVLEESGARLAAVFETHIHNDYLSGGPTLAKKYRADYVLPADSGATLPHHAISDGETRPVGDWLIRAMHTPGHTPHHISYVLESDAGPVAVFTGGSMLVAAVGRTDLISPDMTESLTRRQYRSVRRIAGSLPNPAVVGPTHGAGSFCASGTSTESTSTIEREKLQNPALTTRSEDAFVREQMDSFGLYPAYYSKMGPINTVGGEPLPPLEAGGLSDMELSPHALADAAGSAWLVDLRDPRAFAGGHVPGSVNIPIGREVGVYTGWALPWGSRLVLIADGGDDVAAARLEMGRIGIDNVEGVVTDGLTAWRGHGSRVTGYRVAGFEDLERERPAAVLDVRDPKELSAGRVPGSVNIHFSQILDRADEVPPGVVWVHCTSGHRAAIAASLVSRLGREVVLVMDDFANFDASRMAA